MAKQYWNDDLKQYANEMDNKYNLPEGTMHQIIKQESTGQLGLTSKAGAYGLTQLMPGTAKQMGVKDINDPYQQIEGGAKYYGQLLHNQAKGDPIVAAAMYNSGPNKRAYKTGNLNLLPIETQNYMKEFATATGGQAPVAKSFGEKVLNKIISPAMGSSNYKLLDKPVEYTPDKSTQTSPGYTLLDTPVEYNPTPETPVQPERTLGSALKEVPGNILPSAGKTLVNTVLGVGQAIAHPVDTVKGIDKLIMGEAYKAIPGMASAASVSSPEAVNEAMQTASNVNQAVNNRYGTYQNTLNTLATDPVGLASDLALPGKVLTGGLGKAAGLLSKKAETKAASVSKISPQIPESTEGVPGMMNKALQSTVNQAQKESESAAKQAAAVTKTKDILSGLGNFAASPVSTSVDALVRRIIGPAIGQTLGMVNKSDLPYSSIKEAERAGESIVPFSNEWRKSSPTPTQGDIFGKNSSVISNAPWLSESPLSVGQVLTGLGIHGISGPAGLLAMSPKLVALAAGTTGVGKGLVTAGNKGIKAIPTKGILSQYKEEKDKEK